MKEFLVIRLSSLGDIVHTIPAFAALRRAEPSARISWVVSPKGKEILELVEGLDEIIVVGENGWRNRLRNPDRVALDFQGLCKSSWIGRLSRARRRLGFAPVNLREPVARFFYTEKADPLSEDEHVILKNLKLLERLGLEDHVVRFPLFVPEGIRIGVRARLEETGWTPDRPLVIFNVGAGWPTKRWFPERWIETIKRLDHPSAFPVLLWGNEQERRLASAVGLAAAVPVLPFFSVRDTFALLREAALLISGDTFALQAAGALGLPVVGIFGPTNPRRNGPFAPKDQVVYHELPCSRCYRRECPHLKCLDAVTVDEVVRAVKGSLKSHE